jgi:hypothetical protein
MKKVIAILASISLLSMFTLVLFRKLPWSYFWYTAGITGTIAWVLKKSQKSRIQQN